MNDENKKAKRLKLLHKIMKTSEMYKIMLGFIIYFFITALVIWLVDPAIESFGDSLWFCFASCTTVGYGDVVATSVTGKLLVAVLTIYGIIVLAFIPGVLVSYFTEFNKIKANTSVVKFMDKLERLEELTEEERKEIADKIKERRYKL